MPGNYFSQCLFEVARSHTDATKVAFVFLDRGERETTRWTAADLLRRASSIGRHLLDAGLRGRPVLLAHPPGPDFVAAICGCLIAQAIAVPVPDPSSPRLGARVAGIVGVVRPAALLCNAVQALSPELAALSDALKIATDTIVDIDVDPGAFPPIDLAIPAFLQFTSGSTSAPRGVVVGQDNLAANLAMIRQAFRIGTDVSVTWLPPYHDMGLVGGLLAPLAFGVPAIAMSPLAFMQKPERWLRAIARYRATIAGGPDFAYALCATRASDARLAGLDLSSWRLAFCGAEPVRPSTLNRFGQTFAPAGFRRTSFFPCYGLAEATLLATGDWVAHGGNLDTVDCGGGQGDQVLRIVDPATGLPVADGASGEIWLAGSHIARGYWDDPNASAAVFGATIATEPEHRFFRTGDVGALWDGRLTVSGRIKHILIVRGAKHHAEDLEISVAACHPTLAGGATAAIAVDTGDGEQVVILQELGMRVTDPALLAAIRTEIVRTLSEAHGLRATDIVLVARWSLPRTSSGKVVRDRCRDAWRAGTLKDVGLGTEEAA